MSDDRLRENDIIEQLLDGVGVDDDLRPLGGELRRLRAQAHMSVDPDHRLTDMFESGVPEPVPPRRRWLQRPAVAFAAAFVGVLVVGGLAFALVDRSSGEDPAAVATTSSIATTEAPVAAAAEKVVEVPAAVGESVAAYVGCVVTEVGEYLKRKITDSGFLDRPRVLTLCGVPAVPPLGEEAEAFRLDLNEWLTCAGESFDVMLPELITDPSAINDPLEECGAPPNPLDYDIRFEFDGFDLEFLDDIELPDIDFDSLFEGFKETLPDDFVGELPDDFLDRLPQDFEVPDLEKLFDEFYKNLPEGFEGFGDLDLRGLFEGFEGFEGFDGFDPEHLERFWRDLGEQVPEFDGLFERFLQRLPEDFDFGDLQLWLNEEWLEGDEACQALLDLGLIEDCETPAEATNSA